jgi:hypothetical protein
VSWYGACAFPLRHRPRKRTIQTPQQIDVALPSFFLTVREYWIARFRGQ